MCIVSAIQRLLGGLIGGNFGATGVGWRCRLQNIGAAAAKKGIYFAVLDLGKGSRYFFFLQRGGGGHAPPSQRARVGLGDFEP
jgi:hypothetical protein